MKPIVWAAIAAAVLYGITKSRGAAVLPDPNMGPGGTTYGYGGDPAADFNSPSGVPPTPTAAIGPRQPAPGELGIRLRTGETVGISQLTKEEIADERARNTYFSTGLRDTAEQVEQSIVKKKKDYDSFLVLLFQNGYAKEKNTTIAALGMKLGVYDSATQIALMNALGRASPMVP